MTDRAITEEGRRLEEARNATPWRKWGPYLSERQWGTVREDLSPTGDAWNYLSHDQARSRADAATVLAGRTVGGPAYRAPTPLPP